MYFVAYTLYGCMIVASFCLLFSVTGRILLGRINMESGNPHCDLAAAFFTGMAVWLAVLRTFAWVLPSYRLSFWLSITVFVIIILWHIRKCNIAQGGGADRVFSLV